MRNSADKMTNPILAPTQKIINIERRGHETADKKQRPLTELFLRKQCFFLHRYV